MMAKIDAAGWTWCAALLLSAITASCAKAASPIAHQECRDPDAMLAAALNPLDKREIERLAFICSSHPPTLMANAVIAYDERRLSVAQQYLDQILSPPRSFPEAAVLRARIAIEEGNLPFARHLLEQQIKLAPDHAGLHETYGGALFVGGQLTEARRELTVAGALGAPRWRIAYHLGLIEETSGRLEEAVRLYSESVAGNPGFAPAESRLKALRARP